MPADVNPVSENAFDLDPFNIDLNASNYQPSAAPLDWPTPWNENEGFVDSLWASDMPSFPEEMGNPYPASSPGPVQSMFAPYGDLFLTPDANIASEISTPDTFESQSPNPTQRSYLHQSIQSPRNSSGEDHAPGIGRPRASGTISNSRGLPRRRSRYFIGRSSSTATPVFIPNQSAGDLDPMQRWQESPPEDEPASMHAIMNALNTGNNHTKTRSPDPFRGYRRPASLASSNSGTSISSHQSGTSTKSTASAPTHDPLAAQNQTHSRVRKGRRRGTADNSNKDRIFCCTFCCDKFKNKYDWVRHEKSLHLNLEGWVCAPHGGSPISPMTNRRHCAYCHCLEPSDEHLEEHNYYPCMNEPRTFRRKDHLVQHLRLVHHLDTMPLIDDWKTAAPIVTSRCGFCDHRLASWDERIEHLAAHYRKGSTMSDWRGDHDFEPSVAARVTNAVPPYLLGSESVSMIPFSATDLNTKDHFAQISSRVHWANDGNAEGQQDQTDRTKTSTNNDAGLATSFEQLQTDETPLKTFMEVITLHLSRYARQQMSQGIVPTDEMFQKEARQVMYGSEDSWEQTFVDHPEWISTFREQLCTTGDSSMPGKTSAANHPPAK